MLCETEYLFIRGSSNPVPSRMLGSDKIDLSAAGPLPFFSVAEASSGSFLLSRAPNPGGGRPNSVDCAPLKESQKERQLS